MARRYRFKMPCLPGAEAKGGWLMSTKIPGPSISRWNRLESSSLHEGAVIAGALEAAVPAVLMCARPCKCSPVIIQKRKELLYQRQTSSHIINFNFSFFWKLEFSTQIFISSRVREVNWTTSWTVKLWARSFHNYFMFYFFQPRTVNPLLMPFWYSC